MDFTVHPYKEARKYVNYGNQITVLPNLQWFYCKAENYYFYQARHKELLINIRMTKEGKWIGLIQKGNSIYRFPLEPEFTVSQVLVDIEDDLLHTKPENQIWNSSVSKFNSGN